MSATDELKTRWLAHEFDTVDSPNGVDKLFVEYEKLEAKLSRYEQAAREGMPEVCLTDGNGNDLYPPSHCNEVTALCIYTTALKVENERLSDELAGERPTETERLLTAKIAELEAALASARAQERERALKDAP